jgi:serine/threonine protein phosphatase PrpC
VKKIHSKRVEDYTQNEFGRCSEGVSASSRHKFDSSLSGSTCTLVVQKDQKLTCAWVGDSRAVGAFKAGQGWLARDLSVDHKPDRPEEKARIVTKGGQVRKLEGGKITKTECDVLALPRLICP